jgi:hypothetical protein
MLMMMKNCDLNCKNRILIVSFIVDPFPFAVSILLLLFDAFCWLC